MKKKITFESIATALFICGFMLILFDYITLTYKFNNEFHAKYIPIPILTQIEAHNYIDENDNIRRFHLDQKVPILGGTYIELE